MTVFKVQRFQILRAYLWSEEHLQTLLSGAGAVLCKLPISTVLFVRPLSAPTYLTVCEGGRRVQGGVDERARQVWHGVQRHMSVDMGVQMQSGVCGLLWAHELMSRRKGSRCHR